MTHTEDVLYLWKISSGADEAQDREKKTGEEEEIESTVARLKEAAF